MRDRVFGIQVVSEKDIVEFHRYFLRRLLSKRPNVAVRIFARGIQKPDYPPDDRKDDNQKGEAAFASRMGKTAQFHLKPNPFATMTWPSRIKRECFWNPV